MGQVNLRPFFATAPKADCCEKMKAGADAHVGRHRAPLHAMFDDPELLRCGSCRGHDQPGRGRIETLAQFGRLDAGPEVTTGAQLGVKAGAGGNAVTVPCEKSACTVKQP